MNIKSKVERLEQRAGAPSGVRFVVCIPPQMTREEWTEYARAFTARGGFTLNLDNAGAFEDEPNKQS